MFSIQIERLLGLRNENSVVAAPIRGATGDSTMRNFLRRSIVTSLAPLMFSGLTTSTAAFAQAGFAGGYAHPTNGRVGYHMFSQFSFGQQPCKPGEHMTPSDVTVAGTLPPGLTAPGFAGNGTPYFDGTPRQAGDWHVVATLHDMRCNPAPHVPGAISYGDVDVPVDFHIDP